MSADKPKRMALQLVKNAAFICSSFKDGRCDGVYKKGEDYYITSIDGSASVFYFCCDKGKILSPISKFRKILNEEIGVDIPVEKKIYIPPCNPTDIQAVYWKFLREHNIHLIAPYGRGGGSHGTYTYFSNKEKYYTWRPKENFNPELNQKVDLLFSENPFDDNFAPFFSTKKHKVQKGYISVVGKSYTLFS